MGNQNCCVRPDNPSKTLGNLDTINDEQPETAPQNMQITENVINLETPVLEEKENQAVVKASKKGKVHNDLLEKPVDPITVTTVKQENVGEPEPASLYWNQKNGDIEDYGFCFRLINTFIHSIYLYNDHIIVAYNFCDENENRESVELAVNDIEKNRIHSEPNGSSESGHLPQTGIEPVRSLTLAGF